MKAEALAGIQRGDPASARLRRFMLGNATCARLRSCVQQCREAIGHPIPDALLVQRPYGVKLRELVAANESFVTTAADSGIIGAVLAKVVHPLFNYHCIFHFKACYLFQSKF